MIKKIKVFKDYSEKELQRLKSIIDKINSFDDNIAGLDDEQLKGKTVEFKDRLNNGEGLDDILPEAFAVVREAAKRVLGMRHYEVQLLGGIILHQGRVAEMKTGEGKTLVATLPAYLNALTGRGVHVITSNEYLAERDKEEMGKVHEFLGLSVGVILNKMEPHERRGAYNCDITYGINSEIGFDYLRDNMVMDREERVQRRLNYALIDEIDSILIDEARTPLIISGDSKESSEYYVVIDRFVKALKRDEHFEIDEKKRSATLTPEGIEFTEKHFGIENYAELENIKIQHHVTQGLRANYTMLKDKDYIVRDGEVLIVDAGTGRIMDGRRFSDGLHQAIEAKENVKINEESRTLSTVTLQNLFRMYNKLSGMSGTVMSEEQEFREIYGIDVIKVPTNKPVLRVDKPHRVYKNIRTKYNAVIDEIIESNEKGQPVLVGTSSIEKSEDISALLKRKRVRHHVLNAKNHEEEAKIVERAGEKGAITIATNMAGRGTDIKLTEEVKALGGLKIIGTEVHDSVRIDNQLRGRAGRQGDPGESIFILALDDHIIKNYMSDKHKTILEKTLINDSDEIKPSLILKPVDFAQKSVETDNFFARKNVVGYDNVINTQRLVIYNQRNEMLDNDDVGQYILAMLESVIETIGNEIFNGKIKEEDLNEFKFALSEIHVIRDTNAILFDIKSKKDKLIKEAIEMAKEAYNYEIEKIDEDRLRKLQREIVLRVADRNWIDYLSDVEYLKQGIGLRSYKQIDPVVAFGEEASIMFIKMTENIKKESISMIFLEKHKLLEEKEAVKN